VEDRKSQELGPRSPGVAEVGTPRWSSEKVSDFDRRPCPSPDHCRGVRGTTEASLTCVYATIIGVDRIFSGGVHFSLFVHEKN